MNGVLAGIFNPRAAAPAFRAAKYLGCVGATTGGAAILSIYPDAMAYGFLASVFLATGCTAYGVYRGFAHRNAPSRNPAP